jgi:hypothetical protein
VEETTREIYGMEVAETQIAKNNTIEKSKKGSK